MSTNDNDYVTSLGNLDFNEDGNVNVLDIIQMINTGDYDMTTVQTAIDYILQSSRTHPKSSITDISQHRDYREAVVDRISELILSKLKRISPAALTTLQKTIKGGSVVTGRTDDESLLLYQSDTQANESDSKVLDGIINSLKGVDVKQISIRVDTNKGIFLLFPQGNSIQQIDISGLRVAKELDGGFIKDNVSQFVDVKEIKNNYNKNSIHEFMDLDFSELVSKEFKEQQEIKKFFKEFDYLKSHIPRGITPQFQTDREFFDQDTNSLTHIVNQGINILQPLTHPIYTQKQYNLIQAELISNDNDSSATIASNHSAYSSSIESIQDYDNRIDILTNKIIPTISTEYGNQLSMSAQFLYDLTTAVLNEQYDAALTVTPEPEPEPAPPVYIWEEDFEDIVPIGGTADNIDEIKTSGGTRFWNQNSYCKLQYYSDRIVPGAMSGTTYIKLVAQNNDSSGGYVNLKGYTGISGLKAGKEYVLEVEGLASGNGKLQAWVGDVRGGWPGYAWSKTLRWESNGVWTKGSATFTPKSNTRYGNDPAGSSTNSTDTDHEQGGPYSGVFGQIYLYTGRLGNPNTTDYCCYDNIRIREA